MNRKKIFWLEWIISSTLVFGIVFPVWVFLVSVFVFAIFASLRINDSITLPLASGAFGVFAGPFHWFIWRGRNKRAIQWIIASIIIWPVSSVLSLLVFNPLVCPPGDTGAVVNCLFITLKWLLLVFVLGSLSTIAISLLVPGDTL